jgi:hypothetical protein
LRRPVPLVLALGALAASLGFLLSEKVRQTSVVAAGAGAWSYSFVLLLLFGGVAIIYGWRRELEEWEALGLTFTGFGCLAYSFAIVATRGLHGWIAVSIITSTGVGHVLRAVEIWRRWA